MDFLNRLFSKLTRKQEKEPVILRVIDITGRYPSEDSKNIDLLKSAVLKSLSCAEKSGTSLVVDLDRTRGYSSSFLNKVFSDLGGPNFYQKNFTGHPPLIRFKSEDISLVVEIYSYLNAGANKAASRTKPSRTP